MRISLFRSPVGLPFGQPSGAILWDPPRALGGEGLPFCFFFEIELITRTTFGAAVRPPASRCDASCAVCFLKQSLWLPRLGLSHAVDRLSNRERRGITCPRRLRRRGSAGPSGSRGIASRRARSTTPLRQRYPRLWCNTLIRRLPIDRPSAAPSR